MQPGVSSVSLGAYGDYDLHAIDVRRRYPNLPAVEDQIGGSSAVLNLQKAHRTFTNLLREAGVRATRRTQLWRKGPKRGSASPLLGGDWVATRKLAPWPSRIRVHHLCFA